MLYDEIAIYLKSIQKHEIEIKKQINKHPKWHYNQILSLFNIKYPERMKGKSAAEGKQRTNFGKEAARYKLNENNKLCVRHPLNNKNGDDTYFKIPFLHEKNVLIKDIHFNNNHCGRIQLVNYLHKNLWYWYGMNNDIQEQLKFCIKCNSKNKFISLKKKNKIILDKGPHYRYVADLWYLSSEIQKKRDINTFLILLIISANGMVGIY